MKDYIKEWIKAITKKCMGFLCALLLIIIGVWFFYLFAQPKDAIISTDSANSSHVIARFNHEHFCHASLYCENINLSIKLASNAYNMADYLANPDYYSSLPHNVYGKIELKNSNGYYYDNEYYDNSYRLLAEGLDIYNDFCINAISDNSRLDIYGVLDSCCDIPGWFIVETFENNEILISGDNIHSTILLSEHGNYILTNDKETVQIDSTKSLVLENTHITVLPINEECHLRIDRVESSLDLHKIVYDQLDILYLMDFRGLIDFSYSTKAEKIDVSGKQLNIDFDTDTANTFSYAYGYDNELSSSLTNLSFRGKAFRSTLNKSSIFPSFKEWFLNVVLADPLGVIACALALIEIPFLIDGKKRRISRKDKQKVVMAKKGYKYELQKKIDSLTPQVTSFEELIKKMQDDAYNVELSKDKKYILCRMPGQKRSTNTKALGERYSNQELIQLINNNQNNM